MAWNYRILKHVEHTGEIWYGIHEVHYQDGEPIMYAVEATIVIDEPDDTEVIAQLIRAFTVPVLDAKDLAKK